MKDISTLERPVEGTPITAPSSVTKTIQKIVFDIVCHALYPEKYNKWSQDTERLKTLRSPLLPKELDETHPKITFACKELHTAYQAFADTYFEALRTMGDDNLPKIHTFFQIDINTLDIQYKETCTKVIMLLNFPQFSPSYPAIVEAEIYAMRKIFQEKTKMIRKKYINKK